MNFSKIICNFFFFIHKSIPTLFLSKNVPDRSFQPSFFPTLEKTSHPFLPPLSMYRYRKLRRIFHFHRRKTLFSLPKHAPLHQSFDHSSFRYHQPRGQDTSRWTKVHTLGIRFSASRADQFIDVVEGGGRLLRAISPLPPGAWPKSNVVKIEIIRATTVSLRNRVLPSLPLRIWDPDNPQRPQPVNILQASFRRLGGGCTVEGGCDRVNSPLFGLVAISTMVPVPGFFSR